MKRFIIVAWLCIIVALVCATAQATPAQEEDADQPLIQVALLLDNSGSMSGLIDQARSQLWKFVNEFAMTKKDGQIPRIQVALYTYGTPPPKQLTTLTTDLDLVSEKLFAVSISGGSEHCGQVIQEAVEKLPWSESKHDLKIIFIAGNEPFTQGPVDYAEACKAAATAGIIVNTIHCGDEQAGVNGKWKDGAMLADGSYLCINQNQAVAHIPAPQDEAIARLGVELNETYIAYGEAGATNKRRQAEQDANAAKQSAAGAAVQRMVTKANAQYRNARWDLVDALRNEQVKLEDIDEEDLPEAMQDMTLAERKAYVQQHAERRAEIQKKINELNKARMEFVAAERKKRAAETGEEDTLDKAMISAVREQAVAKGFQVETPEEE